MDNLSRKVYEIPDRQELVRLQMRPEKLRLAVYPRIIHCACRWRSLFIFDAYNMNNSYFKLRDIAQALDFGVTWDGAGNTIILETSARYSHE